MNRNKLSISCIVLLSFAALPTEALDLPLRGPSGEMILGLGRLESIEYLPDGRHIASAGGMGVFIWNAETGELERWMQTGPVSRMAFSPDGSMVLTDAEYKEGNWTHPVTLWDVLSGERIQAFRTQSDVTDLAFSPDGQSVLIASSERDTGHAATLYDVQTRQRIRSFSASGVLCGAISPDGRHVLTASEAAITLWNAETGEEVRSHTVPGLCSGFSPDGQWIYAVEDSQVRLFNVETGENGLTFEHEEEITHAAVSPGGQHIVAVSNGSWESFWTTNDNYSVVRTWDMETGEEVSTFEHTEPIATFALSPDGRHIATATSRYGYGSVIYDISMLDMRTGVLVQSLVGHLDHLSHNWQTHEPPGQFSPDGRFVLTSHGALDESGTRVALWDAQTGQRIRSFDFVKESDEAYFSPDGRRLLFSARLWDADAGSYRRRVPVLLDVDTGEVIHAFTEGQSPLAFSPDGDYVVTGDDESDNEVLRLWDANTYDMIRTFEDVGSLRHGLVDGPSLAFSSDNRFLLTRSSSGVVRIWDMSATDPISPPNAEPPELPLRGPSGEIILGLGTLKAVAYSPDGKYIATGGCLGVFLWDAESIQLLRRFPESEVKSVAFSPDSRMLLSGSQERVALWDVETGTRLRTFDEDYSRSDHVSFSADGRYMLTGGTRLLEMEREPGIWNRHAVARLWDVETGEQAHEFIMPSLESVSSELEDVALSPNGRQLMMATRVYDTAAGRMVIRIGVWDVETGEEIYTLRGGNESGLTTVGFSPDGSLALIALEKTLQLWDTETWTSVRTIRTSDRVYCAAFSPDGMSLLTSHDNQQGRIYAYDVQTGVEVYSLEGHAGGTSFLALSPDGRKVVSASWTPALGHTLQGDQTVKIWDVETGETIHTITGYNHEFTDAMFSPDGRYVLTNAGDLWDSKRLTLWDSLTGAPIRTFENPDWISCYVFSPDGSYLLLGGSSPGQIQWTATCVAELVDLETGEVTRTYRPEGEYTFISCAAVSANGRYVLAGGSDWDQELEQEQEMAWLWDVETGELLRDFVHHGVSDYGEGLQSVAISPDGNAVLTMGYADDWSGKCTARLWDVSDLELRVENPTAVGEWELY